MGLIKKTYVINVSPRVVMAPSFPVTVAVQYFLRGGVPKMQDIFPPSRISDLHLAQYEDNEMENLNSTLLAPLPSHPSPKHSSLKLRYGTAL